MIQRRTSTLKNKIGPFGLLFLLIGLTTDAMACGRMGLDRPGVGPAIFTAIFLPMVLLVPVEIFALNLFSNLGSRTVPAYVACLFAKFCGILLVVFAAFALGNDFIVAELLYSLTHFIVSLIILSAGFNLTGTTLIASSAVISTVIPWLYSLAFYLLIQFVPR